MRTVVAAVVIAVLLCGAAAVASPSFDMLNYRVAAMGFADTGLADDDAAVVSNPGALPYIRTYGTQISPWPSRLSVNAAFDGPADGFSALYSARNSAGNQGWGLGYMNVDNGADVDTFTGGYGIEFPCGVGLGASLNYVTNGDDDVLVDVGALYRIDAPMQDWRVGLVVRDVTDESGAGTTVDVGASVRFDTGLLVSAEIEDASDEVDTRFNIGGEYSLPMSNITARAGAVDGDITAGLGYRWMAWEVGATWVDFDGDDMWIIGGSTSF